MFKYLSFFNLFKTPMAPLILGLGGTLPFIFLSVVIWLGSTDLQLIALFNLINYSIIILSFVGAVHWGAAMMRNDIFYGYYLISIIPAILSWFYGVYSKLFTYIYYINDTFSYYVFYRCQGSKKSDSS